MIDIEDMIGKRRYRVTLPPEEIFSNIDSVLLDENPHVNEAEWYASVHEERYHCYRRNFRYDYIMSKFIPGTKVNVQKLRGEFYTKKLSNERLLQLRDDVGARFDVLIRKVDEFGCVCEGICFSALYEQLGKNLIDEELVKNFKIQESKISSLRFLDRIFIGVLGGEVIEEEKDDLVLKLLMNDSGTREITNVIDKLFDEATTEVLICGWVGTHYIPKLRDLKSKGVDVKFITHKPGEAKGQPWKSEVDEAYRSLCSDFGLDKISSTHNMHGRTIVVDNKALIGTMDLNSSSLTGAHTEFAVFTNNPDIVRRMRAIFNTKFVPLSASE